MQYLTEKEDGTVIEADGDDAVFTALCDVKESLETLFYQYHSLYDRWMDERKTAVKNDAVFAKQTELLAAEVKKMDALTTGLPRAFAEIMKVSANQTTQALKEASVSAANEQMGETVKQFNQLFTQAAQQLRAYQLETVSAFWKTVVMVMSSSVLTAGLMAAVLFPYWTQPHTPLTEKQVYDLYRGSQLSSIWYNLSDKEQKKLHDLLTGKVIEKN